MTTTTTDPNENKKTLTTTDVHGVAKHGLVWFGSALRGSVSRGGLSQLEVRGTTVRKHHPEKS